MNYFAHGRRFVDRPYVLAGTALPDWLQVIDRRVRVRARRAREFTGHADPVLADLAAGVAAHHTDDDWFHRSAAFAQLSARFSQLVRQVEGEDGLRSWFLGHILVELLLDAELIGAEPDGLAQYYQAMRGLDAERLAWGISELAGRPVGAVPYWLGRFLEERFLWDYLEDDKLLVRVNQVLRRVGLPLLGGAVVTVLPEARAAVRELRPALLANGGD